LKESLKKLGIVGPRHYRHLMEQLRKAQVRTEKLVQELDAARSDARTYRSKVDELAKTLQKQRAESEHQRRRAEKLTQEIDRIRKESSLKAEKRQREIDEAVQKRATAVEELHHRLAAAEHQLSIAREALMAVDVKLDILEGAANVLDLRTRQVITQRDHATESAV
jgi:predicted  nucleic acid-binding Zn-ribbon protein